MNKAAFKSTCAATLMAFSLSALAQELANAPVFTTQWTRLQPFDGVLEAVKQSTISAQTTGQVKAIHSEVDDFVPKGTVILEIDDTEPRARLNQVRAQLAEARAALEDTRTEYDRAQALYQDRIIPKANLDKSKAAFETAQARFKAAEAGLVQSERQFSYTQVVAPYAGILMQRHVEVGESVRPGQPLLTGLALDKLRVNSQIPQSLIEAARQNKQATVLLPNGRVVSSEKLTFYPYADPQSHTFRMRVELENVEGDGLYPGMAVKVSLPMGSRQVLIVPDSALWVRGELSAVYVLDNQGDPRLRQVRSGERREGQVEILAGLQAGERVVLDPVAVLAQIYADRNPKQAKPSGTTP